jgi:hypothetical protein
VQQFFKNAAEVKGEQPLSLPAGSETPCATLRRTEKRVRKATAFRGRANKTALPYKSPERTALENVPVEHFQRAKIKLISITNFRYLFTFVTEYDIIKLFLEPVYGLFEKGGKKCTKIYHLKSIRRR